MVSREHVTRRFADVVDHKSRIGPATLAVRPGAQLPVFLLAMGDIVPGSHRIVDLTLKPERIIHRYRAA